MAGLGLREAALLPAGRAVSQTPPVRTELSLFAPPPPEAQVLTLERGLCIPSSGQGGRGSRISNPPGLCDLRPCPPGQKKGCLPRAGTFLKETLLWAAARSSPYVLRKAVVVAACKAPQSPGPELLWESWIRIPSGSQNSLPVKKFPKNAQNLPLAQRLALWLLPVPISRLRPN